MTSTAAQPAEKRGWLQSPFVSFRHRGYAWLWAANVCHGAVQGAQGFLIIWLVIETLERDYPSTLFTVALAIPALLLGLPAGRFADRADRRLLLVASHLAVALVLLLTAILTTAGVLSLGLVLVMTVLAAMGMTMGEPVRLALIPALVPRERILNGNALSGLGAGLGAVAGIPLTGLALDAWPVESSFVVLAVVAAAGALFLFPLRVPDRELAPDCGGPVATGNGPATILGDMAQAFRFVWTKLELRLLFVVLLLSALLSPWLVLDFPAMQDRLDVGVRAVAFLGIFLGIGAIVSTVALACIRRVRGAGAWYGVVVIASALAALGAWFSTSYGLTGFAMALSGVAVGVQGLLFLTIVQSHAPVTVMGRVMGIYVALTAAAGLLAPPLARGGRALVQDDGWPAFATIVLVGIVAFVLVRNPRLRRMPSHPEPEEPDEATEPGPG